MSDKDFDFRPVERRAPRRFEPPPWEQDKFEDLARKKAEEERRAEEARREAEAAAPVEPTEQAVPPAVAEDDLGAAIAELARVVPAVTADEVVAAREGTTAAASVQAAPAPEASAARKDGGAAIDPAVFTAMIEELRAEEAPRESGAWKISVGVALVCVIFGSVMFVWGMAAMRAAAGKPVGIMMTVILLVFGAGFIFGGLYVAVRELRKRGVL